MDSNDVGVCGEGRGGGALYSLERDIHLGDGMVIL